MHLACGYTRNNEYVWTERNPTWTSRISHWVNSFMTIEASIQYLYLYLYLYILHLTGDISFLVVVLIVYCSRVMWILKEGHASTLPFTMPVSMTMGMWPWSCWKGEPTNLPGTLVSIPRSTYPWEERCASSFTIKVIRHSKRDVM